MFWLRVVKFFYVLLDLISIVTKASPLAQGREIQNQLFLIKILENNHKYLFDMNN